MTFGGMQGDPSKAGEEFTVRLRFPNGYKVKPHTHPTTEHVTVLAGTFLVGMGSTFDPTKMVALEPGGFVSAPAEHAHYAAARGETVVQIHAIGPFALTYSNPSDAPVAMREGVRGSHSFHRPPARPSARDRLGS